jgi:CubicO group peptidase (beta-lactamase class C family)
MIGALSVCLACALVSAAGIATAASGGDTSGRMSDAQIVDDLRSHLNKLVSQDKFSGVVLLARNGKILFEHAYGDADKAFGIPNKVDTRFNLGSMGKMFTAVSIMQLLERGKLSLDARLIDVLPDYPNKDVAGKITIYQLLTHTSGLGDFFTPEFAGNNPSKFATLESLLPFFVDQPLRFAPGTQWAYSNAGYIVLGLVVQKVSGESYYDYVRQHVFALAGMTDTGNWPADEVIPNRAQGYTTVGVPPGSPRKSNIFSVQRGSSAGGGYSTVGDLLKFAAALEGHKLLSKQYTDMMMAGKAETTFFGEGKYAFAMFDNVINSVRLVGHGGSGPGIMSNLDMYPDSGYVVAIMTNYDNDMRVVNARLRIELTGQTLPHAISLSADALTSLAGKYAPVLPASRLMRGTPPPIAITAVRDGLQVNLGRGPIFHLLPVSADEFFDENDPAHRVVFLRDQSGQVTSLRTDTGFGVVPPMTATKLPG